MGKKLYVGGLPPEVTDVQLNTMFAACGTVTSAEIRMEKKTGASRGFGFVEMSTVEEAQEAIKKFHNAPLGANKLVVNEARPIPEKPRKGFRGFDGGNCGGGYGDRSGGYGGLSRNTGRFGGGIFQKGHDRRGGGSGKGGS